VNLCFLKICYILHRILLPIYFGNSALFVLFMFLFSEFTCGIIFGYMSQISHISDERDFPDYPKKEWAELQILTSCDYCHDSYFWTYFSGYLNYQGVHHLFPALAGHYYPEIAHIVKETCVEYNIPYTEYNSFLECCKRHLNHVEQFQIEMPSFSFLKILERVI